MSQSSESAAATLDKNSVGEKQAGKYLTFKLAEEKYGLEILKVQEIIQMQAVTRVPRTPDYVRGGHQSSRQGDEREGADGNKEGNGCVEEDGATGRQKANTGILNVAQSHTRNVTLSCSMKGSY